MANSGGDLFDIEWVSGSAGRGRTLRVYIDKRGGVSLEDCTNVSRGLNLILDVDDAIPGSGYSLEVSSPGLERVLREPRHFSNAVGSTIHVKLREPKENIRVFKGRLVAFESDLVFELENKSEIRLGVDDIAKARIVFVEEKGQKQGNKRKS